MNPREQKLKEIKDRVQELSNEYPGVDTLREIRLLCLERICYTRPSTAVRVAIYNVLRTEGLSDEELRNRFGDLIKPPN